MRPHWLAVMSVSLACGNAQTPSPATPVASSSATSSRRSATIDHDADDTAPASSAMSADEKALCRSQPPSCKPRIVEAAPFCGPTMLWQMQQAGISPGDPRATRPVKACTCDHCASDADCGDAPGGHCRELEADIDCVLPEKRCVYPNGPCAACPGACLHSGESLACSHRPPPP